MPHTDHYGLDIPTDNAAAAAAYDSGASALAASVRSANGGDLQGAVALLETYLAEHPRDVLVHRQAQFELFWSGENPM